MIFSTYALVVLWPSLNENLRLGLGTVFPDASQIVTFISSPVKQINEQSLVKTIMFPLKFKADFRRILPS